MKKSIFSIFLCFSLFTSGVNASESRVFIEDQCPVSADYAGRVETAATIAATFIGKVAGNLVGGLIDSVVNTLSDIKTVSFVSSNRNEGWYQKAEASNIFKRSADVKCLVFVIADNFESIDSGAVSDNLIKNQYDEAIKNAGANTQHAKQIKDMKNAVDVLAKLGIKKIPQFYFEAAFISTGNKPVFTMQPVFVHYPVFFGDNVIFGASSRDILLQAEFSLPNAAQPFASTQLIKVDKLQQGALTTERVRSTRLPWYLQPAYEAKPSDSGRILPFNIKVSLNEVAQPGQLGIAISTALKEVKSDIKTEVEKNTKELISSAEREKAKAILYTAATDAFDKYAAGYTAVETAQKAVKDSNNEAEKSTANSKLLLSIAKYKNLEVLAQITFDEAGIPFTRIPLPPNPV